ncbi:MAG: peroxiredoxin [Armatimonadetes bacterium]|nr:peroxiredoxin [Armatimonadota bacterium]
MLKPGDAFPSFSLPDQDEKIVDNTSLAGNPYVIYFYPKDDTSGCTMEACEFTENLPKFGDIKVIGVSPDSAKKHTKFIAKYELGVTLLADEEKQLISACGLWIEKSMYGRKYMGVDRTTFLVGADGKIIQVWEKVKPAGHAAEVLKAAKS